MSVTAAVSDRSAIVIRSKSGRATYLRVVFASCVGTTIEWYDFFIYGFLAPLVFDVLFFPNLNGLIGTIAVFATFAVGFVARPLGGIVFGHFGDRVGRKSILLVTLLLMGLATSAIGILPTYDQIGIRAPILLVTLRFLQGFALGGESIGALLLTVEGSPSGRRGFFGSLVQASGPLGVLLASAVVAAVTSLPRADLLSWGWRLPFVGSLALVLVGIYVRMRIEESACFTAAADEIVRVPIVQTLKRYWTPTLVTFTLCLAETSFYYLSTIFALAYGTRTLALPGATLTLALFVANCVALLTVPMFGALSDRIGRRPMFLAGLSATIVYIYPFFLLLGTKDARLVIAAIVVASGLIHPMMFGPEGSFFAELFDTPVRFSGVSFGKQLGTVLGGGVAPLVATTLLAWSGGSVRPIVWYFVALAALALVATMAAHESRGRQL
jgi:metabolite-proton symporter